MWIILRITPYLSDFEYIFILFWKKFLLLLNGWKVIIGNSLTKVQTGYMCYAGSPYMAWITSNDVRIWMCWYEWGIYIFKFKLDIAVDVWINKWLYVVDQWSPKWGPVFKSSEVSNNHCWGVLDVLKKGIFFI